jgi:hypothetical protein
VVYFKEVMGGIPAHERGKAEGDRHLASALMRPEEGIGLVF